MLMSNKKGIKCGETHIFHGIFVSLSGVICEVGLHMLFNEKVVSRRFALCFHVS